jgi:hypothetical protein
MGVNKWHISEQNQSVSIKRLLNVISAIINSLGLHLWVALSSVRSVEINLHKNPSTKLENNSKSILNHKTLISRAFFMFLPLR